MPVSPDDFQKLKNPFGDLVHDSDVSRQLVHAAVRGAQLIATVGDATTERLVSFGIIPDIAVIDGKERRIRRGIKVSYFARELRCANPSGLITKNALDTIADALQGIHPARIFVDGEEDMLALPLFHMVPVGAVVLYGQPLEGLVIVKIDASKQKEAKDLMDRIGID
jgi:uncharacterized protein (UPF0218 family)